MSHTNDASPPVSTPHVSTHDVLIVGGGPVGGTTAALLAQAGLEVAVIEAGDPAILSRPDSDGRAIAIALSAQRVLAGAGLWERLGPVAQPILDIRVTDGASPFYLHYDHTVIGDDPFGWIIENEAIKAAVFARLAELPNVRLFANARVANLDMGPGLVTATLGDGTQIRASLAVAADGRGSPTRTAAGIGVNRWDYHQHGIVCAIAHEFPHEGVAHEHFLPGGPFAILPMTGNRSGIVWTERADLAPAIVAQDDAGFLAELAPKVGDFLGKLSLASSRFSYPLTLQISERIIDRRLALIGDAAHGMHPVAGQGMNIGLRDVAALAEVVVDARRHGLDCGAPDVLTRYQRWRRFDTMMMLAVTDGLVRLFSNDIPPLRLARDLGLAAVERMPGVKRVLMRHAMGVAGDLPRLMRGERL